jgi:serine phosphatase RsbU (regulator of sigma subunit)
VTDVQAPDGSRLGDDGIRKSLYGSFTQAQTLLDSVLDTVESFRAGREMADDLTLVAVQLASKPATAVASIEATDAMAEVADF